MKYDLNEEKALLILLESEDEGNGVKFSDHVYVQSHRYSAGVSESFLENQNLTSPIGFFFARMSESGFVDRRDECRESVVFYLTASGHQRLEWHRQNTPLRVFIRWLNEKLDKALTSIVLPLLVSLLTVLVMNYFGLSQNQSSSDQEEVLPHAESRP